MMIDCCQQQRTYEKFYGLLAARFCLLKKEFMLAFEELVVEQYWFVGGSVIYFGLENATFFGQKFYF